MSCRHCVNHIWGSKFKVIKLIQAINKIKKSVKTYSPSKIIFSFCDQSLRKTHYINVVNVPLGNSYLESWIVLSRNPRFIIVSCSSFTKSLIYHHEQFLHKILDLSSWTIPFRKSLIYHHEQFLSGNPWFIIMNNSFQEILDLLSYTVPSENPWFIIMNNSFQEILDLLS